MIKQELTTILRYLQSNILLVIVISYIFISVLLKSFFGINITIPCLWTTIFGVKCPGCGLTTASVELTHLHFAEAFKINPLVYLVVPAVIYYILSGYFVFRKGTK